MRPVMHMHAMQAQCAGAVRSCNARHRDPVVVHLPRSHGIRSWLVLSARGAPAAVPCAVPCADCALLCYRSAPSGCALRRRRPRRRPGRRRQRARARRGSRAPGIAPHSVRPHAMPCHAMSCHAMPCHAEPCTEVAARHASTAAGACARSSACRRGEGARIRVLATEDVRVAAAARRRVGPLAPRLAG